MTDRKLPPHGLPYIARPHTTWMQSTAFSILRHQRWTSVFASSLVILASIILFVLTLEHWAQEMPRLGKLLWFLGTLVLAQVVLFVCMFSDGGAARPWVIKAALASATDEERAVLFHQIQRRSQSHWRKEPLSHREIFSVFAETRESYRSKTLRKKARLFAALEAQIEELQLYVDDEDNTTRSTHTVNKP